MAFRRCKGGSAIGVRLSRRSRDDFATVAATRAVRPRPGSGGQGCRGSGVGQLGLAQLGGGGLRQTDDEARQPPRLALDFDRPLHSLSELLDNREPEARADGSLAAVARVQEEALEGAGKLVRLEA